MISFLFNIFAFTPKQAYAADKIEEGYIELYADFEDGMYSCIKKGDKLYLLAEDIASITHFQYSDEDGILAFWRENQALMDVVIQPDGKTSAMNHEYDVEILKHKKQYYLPLNEMLYLLHAQWYSEDGKVYVMALLHNLFDVGYSDEYYEIKQNQTKPTELLMNGESMLTNTVRTTLASVFNDFDGKIFIPWWPKKGFTPTIDEQYEEALMKLTVNDTSFLSGFDPKKIDEKMSKVYVGYAKSCLTNMKSVLDLPTNLEGVGVSEKANQKAFQWTIDNMKEAQFMKFFPQYDVSKITPEDVKTLSKAFGYASDGLSLYKIGLDAVETWNRSQSWSGELEAQFKLLADFDDYRYDRYITKRINRVAQRLIDEKKYMALNQTSKTFEDLAGFGLDKVFGLSPFGPYFALFNMGMEGAKLIPGVKNSLDEADTAYMVSCMIKLEDLAMGQMIKSREDLSDAVLFGGNNEQIEEKVKTFRNSMMLALQLNIRSHSYVYYCNQLVNKTPNWESTKHAKHIEEQILDGYVLLSELMETKYYDDLLLLEDFDHMYADDQNCLRKEVKADVFHKGSEVSQWLKQEPLASMAMCPTGTRTMTAEFINEESYVDSYALGYSQGGPLAGWDDRAGIISAAPCDLDKNGKQELVVTTMKNQNGQNNINASIYEKEEGKIVCKDTVQLTSGDTSTLIYTAIGLVNSNDGKQYLLCQDMPNFMEYTLYAYEAGKFKVAYDLSVNDTGFYQLQDNINGTKQGIWDPMDTTNPSAKYNNLDQGEALQKALLDMGLPQAKSTIGSEKIPTFIKNKAKFKWLTGYVNNIKTQDKTMTITSTLTIKDYTGINKSSKKPKDKHFKEEKKDLKTAWNEWMSSNGYQYNIAFHEADYDGDGKKEAFGVASSTPEGIYDGQFPETFMEAVMCFINANGSVSVVNSLYSGSVESNNLKANGKEFFVVNKHYTSELVSTLYGVKGGQAYEAKVPVTMGSIQNNSDGTITALIPTYDRGFHDWDTGFFQYNPSTGDFDLVNKTITISKKYYPNF